MDIDSVFERASTRYHPLTSQWPGKSVLTYQRCGHLLYFADDHEFGFFKEVAAPRILMPLLLATCMHIVTGIRLSAAVIKVVVQVVV